MARTIDVAIVGAGPYGLSLAAHLRDTGLTVRIFGRPMALWRSAMPAGMQLKSQPYASNLSDPAGAATLKAYCAHRGEEYVPYGKPVRLADFTAYGGWFQRTQVPDLTETLVRRIASVGEQFEVTLDDGETLLARRVVVAVGVEHFDRMPPLLAELPGTLVTHSSAHTDLSRFAGTDLTVLGGGQSALETAALAAEAGARVRVVVRAPKIAWNGDPLRARRSLRVRLREPEAPLGSGWTTLLYSTRPDLLHRLPARRRARIARTALGPAGAYWLRPRVEGRLPVLTDHELIAVEPGADSLRLTLRDGAGPVRITTDHVIAATGYRPDLSRLTFLDEQLAGGIATLDGAPAVDRVFQSSVPGLYFTGPVVASSFGPVMRFVHGCDFAAHRLAQHLTGTVTTGRSLARAAG
ncbi:NAD(P)-binding domain-containing protein [Actinocatenispora sera]|uniref:NAD(P)-binding domain-containing protein n=1 Tax=Actinocatenispora sera TaxID=390989 RepID=UPI003411F617